MTPNNTLNGENRVDQWRRINKERINKPSKEIGLKKINGKMH